MQGSAGVPFGTPPVGSRAAAGYRAGVWGRELESGVRRGDFVAESTLFVLS